MPVLRKNPAEQRYEVIEHDQVLGHISYRPSASGAIDLIHTEVDPSQEGKGLGGQLARFALEDIRASGARAIPTCSFIARYIERHPDLAAVRASPAHEPGQ